MPKRTSEDPATSQGDGQSASWAHSSRRSDATPRARSHFKGRRGRNPPPVDAADDDTSTGAPPGAGGTRRGGTNAQTDVLLGGARSAICVQRLDDSLNSAIHTRYRSLLRSSSMHEPRGPPLEVVQISHRVVSEQTTGTRRKTDTAQDKKKRRSPPAGRERGRGRRASSTRPRLSASTPSAARPAGTPRSPPPGEDSAQCTWENLRTETR